MNEITFIASLKATKNNVSVGPLVTTKVQTMEAALSVMHHDLQSVGNGAAEDVATGDVDLTKQYCVLLINRASANFVTVKLRKDVTPTDTDAGIMLPGEPWGPVRMPAQSGGYPKLRFQSDTAASLVEVIVTEAGNPAA